MQGGLQHHVGDDHQHHRVVETRPAHHALAHGENRRRHAFLGDHGAHPLAGRLEDEHADREGRGVANKADDDPQLGKADPEAAHDDAEDQGQHRHRREEAAAELAAGAHCLQLFLDVAGTLGKHAEQEENETAADPQNGRDDVKEFDDRIPVHGVLRMSLLVWRRRRFAPALERSARFARGVFRNDVAKNKHLFHLELGAIGRDIIRKHRRGHRRRDRLGFARRSIRFSTATLAMIHFWPTAISGIGLLVGLFTLLAGNPAIEPLRGISSLAFYAGMLLLAFIALPASWRS